MITILLTPAQIAVLDGVLSRVAREEHVEVRHTETGEYKSGLRDHVHVVEALQERLAPSVRLDRAEARVLEDVIRLEMAELRVEARRSATWSYKASLREQSDQLRSVLLALEGALGAIPA